VSDEAWLAPEPVVERVPLGSDSWVDVVRGFVSDPDALHEHLLGAVTWEQGNVFRYEKTVDMPRLNARAWGRRAHPALAQAGTWLDRESSSLRPPSNTSPVALSSGGSVMTNT